MGLEQLTVFRLVILSPSSIDLLRFEIAFNIPDIMLSWDLLTGSIQDSITNLFITEMIQALKII